MGFRVFEVRGFRGFVILGFVIGVLRFEVRGFAIWCLGFRVRGWGFGVFEVPGLGFGLSRSWVSRFRVLVV